MPRIQPLMTFLRPLAAPRTVPCRQHFRFSTATRLCAEKPSSTSATPSKPTAPSQAPPAAPTTPQEAARAADLAAAEAITESDSAQPPEPKPDLPSQRAKASPATKKADDVFPPASPTSHPDTQSALKKPSRTTAQSPRADAVPTPPAPSSSKPNTESSLKKAARTPSAVTIELPPPKYHVARSASKNLPIYTDYKRGGNLHLTTIRKITGDASALRDELRVYLNKKEGEVSINSVTGHVVVKGHHTAPIKTFLEQRGM